MNDHDKGSYTSEVTCVGKRYQHHCGNMVHKIGSKVLENQGNKDIIMGFFQSVLG